MYRVAETPEEKVILLLEQARTDRRVPLKKQLLEQTLDELQLSEPDAETMAADDAAAAAADAADGDNSELDQATIQKEKEEARKRVEKRIADEGRTPPAACSTAAQPLPRLVHAF